MVMVWLCRPFITIVVRVIMLLLIFNIFVIFILVLVSEKRVHKEGLVHELGSRELLHVS